MITTELQGGLGNQLFQMSAAVGVALDNEDVAGFDISKFGHTVQGFNPRKYVDNVFRNAIFEEGIEVAFNCTADPSMFHYEKIPYVEMMKLIGYFQSYKYFDSHKDKIIEMFCATEEVRQKFKDQVLQNSMASFMEPTGPTCSIHVRRGSYVKDASHHPPCSIEYYEKAMESMDSYRQGMSYLVFSDDKQWCEENLLPLANENRKIEFHSKYEDWEEMWFMSLCDNNIIANSSFSWWSAYLNDNDTKQVVYPSRWFGPAYAYFDTKDLCPEEWKSI